MPSVNGVGHIVLSTTAENNERWAPTPQTSRDQRRRSRLEPFKKFTRMPRSQLDGHPHLGQGASLQRRCRGMNNKIKTISRRSIGFRSAANFIAAIYHCCARLPLQPTANYSLRTGAQKRVALNDWYRRYPSLFAPNPAVAPLPYFVTSLHSPSGI
jgi:hypothetical protein